MDPLSWSAIPGMMISGTSRMLPNEAVLRWPRLGLEKAEKIHTNNTHANNYNGDKETMQHNKPLFTQVS